MQVAFAVRQREPKTVDEAVTATLEIPSYLRPGVRQEVSASAVTEEAGIAVTSSTGSGQDTVVEMLKTLTARLDRLETSLEDVAAAKRSTRTTMPVVIVVVSNCFLQIFIYSKKPL